MRNVQLDKRLNELKQAQTQHSTSQVINKYANHHNNDSNKVINSTINKSGANLTANFQRKSVNGIQTQRAADMGSNTGRNSRAVNAQLSSINAQVTSQTTLTYQPSIKGNTSMNKHSISSVTSKILGEEKENIAKNGS